jgi:hypothetical protein
MQSIQESDAPIMKSTSNFKKVKIANRGSEIRQLRAITEAARERATASKTRHNNIVINKTIAPNAQPGVGKLRVEQRDEPETFPEKCNILTSKKTRSARVEDRQEVIYFGKYNTHHASPKRTFAVPRLDIVATEAATTTQTNLIQDLALQRMCNHAIQSLKKRRRVAQMALDGVFPLMKSNETIEIAVAVLEQQIEDCCFDIQRLKGFAHTSRISDCKATDLSVRVPFSHLDSTVLTVVDYSLFGCTSIGYEGS